MRLYGDSRRGVGVACAKHCSFVRKLPFYLVLGKGLCSLQTQCLLTEIASMLPGYKSPRIVVECCDSPYIIGSAYLYSHG